MSKTNQQRFTCTLRLPAATGRYTSLEVCQKPWQQDHLPVGLMLPVRHSLLMQRTACDSLLLAVNTLGATRRA